MGEIVPFRVPESKDNQLPKPNGGDHDEPYRFDRKPNSRSPFPFTEKQYTRLLILKSRFSEIVPSCDAPKTTTLARRQDVNRK